MVINGKNLQVKKCDTFRGPGRFLVVNNIDLMKAIYNNGMYSVVKQEKEASSYVLMSMSKSVSVEDFSEAELVRRKLIFPISQFSTGASLGQIFTSDGFKAQQVVTGDNGLVTVDFESSLPGTGGQRAINGRLAFNPKQQYHLVQYEINYIGKSPAPSTTDKGTRTLLQRGDNYVVSQEKVDSFFTKDQKLFQSMNFEYGYETKPPVADEQYELSFYGVTPPADTVYEDRKFNWQLWGGLGAALIMASLVLVYIARGRKRSNLEG